MYCETAKVRRVASMFKYYRKDPPLRLCGVLMSPLDLAEKKLKFFSRSLWPPLMHTVHCKYFSYCGAQIILRAVLPPVITTEGFRKQVKS